MSYARINFQCGLNYTKICENVKSYGAKICRSSFGTQNNKTPANDRSSTVERGLFKRVGEEN